jgi:hypothetical protein
MSNDQTGADLFQSSEEVLRQLKEASDEMRRRSERTQEMIADSMDIIERIDSTLLTDSKAKT